MENAKWIWENKTPKGDEYCDFRDTFDYNGGKVYLKVSACGENACYINGRYAYSGQYPDYPYLKVFDKIDITGFCKKGENEIVFTVWCLCDVPTATHAMGPAGLYYKVVCGDNVLAQSGEKTLSRKNPAYTPYKRQIITWQLGLSFHYDSEKEDGFCKENGFHESVHIPRRTKMKRRPGKMPKLYPVLTAKLKKQIGENKYLFDFGKEVNGFISLSAETSAAQELKITYGENLVKGEVMSDIGGREFSVYYRAKAGKSHYENPFIRFGGRYFEVICEKPLKSISVMIRERAYPVKRVKFTLKNPLDRRIYNVSVRTLRLCMNDHYEDCPWREQGLYTLDSRNQMLFGYYAFREFRFPKSNLWLISEDRRPDGHLSITFPQGPKGLTIPSFTLIYFMSVAEYLRYSGKKDLPKQVISKCQSVMEVFENSMKNGLVPDFIGEEYWNFYEWSDDLAGVLGKADKEKTDLCLNAFLSLAVDNYNYIRSIYPEMRKTTIDKNLLNKAIREKFYNPEKGLFRNSDDGDNYSKLGNALAVLCGAATREESKVIAEHLKNDSSITEATLSMHVFKYDALLSVDEGNMDFIIDEIRKNYSYMLRRGATSFWETIKGKKDFYDAGSLCHGWSAIPIYYYHLAKESHPDKY